MNQQIFAQKSVFFLVLLLIAGLAIENYVYDFPQLNKLKNNLDKDIIFFGDSVIRTTDQNDIDKSSIATMLDKELKSYSVLDSSHAAYHLEVYEAYSKFLCNQEAKPKLVIIPINLRSLRPSSISQPRYQFEIERALLESQNPIKNLWDRFYYLFYLNGERTQKLNKIWENEIIYFNNTIIGKNSYFAKPLKEDDKDLFDKLTKHIQFSYLYTLKKDNRHITAFNQMLSNYKNCNISLILYITPNDFQKNIEYTGDYYLEITQNNINILNQIAQKYGHTIMDMSSDLDSSYFSYHLIPNEHLNEHGRRYIAIQLKQAITQRE